MLEIPLSGIKKIEEIAKSSDEFISLSQGSVKVGGIPQEIKEYLREVLKTDKTDYYESCWGLKPLREKLAMVLSRDYKANITPNDILPTHGCIGGLSLLYLTILNPGDEVIIPEPTYPAYTTLCKASRATPVYISMLDDKGHCAIDIDKIKAATTPKTKIIVLANPGNPTGMIVPMSTIKALLAWCEAQGIFLIVDEAYRDYAFTPAFESVLPLVSTSEWLICASTFSKNMAMSGWRVGYLVIPQRVNKALAGMQDALLNCLNNTAQYAAMFALEHPEYTRHFHQIVKQNRDMTISLLKPLVDSHIVSFQEPLGSLFLFIKTQQPEATDLCMSILYQAKVSLVPGSSFGPSGAPFIRLCYARDREYLQEGIQRLIKFFM